MKLLQPPIEICSLFRDTNVQIKSGFCWKQKCLFDNLFLNSKRFFAYLFLFDDARSELNYRSAKHEKERNTKNTDK
jgi:hypothetical protein